MAAIGNGCKWLVNFLIIIWSLIDPKPASLTNGTELVSFFYCKKNGLMISRGNAMKGLITASDKICPLEKGAYERTGTYCRKQILCRRKPLKQDTHLLEVQKKSLAVGRELLIISVGSVISIKLHVAIGALNCQFLCWDGWLLSPSRFSAVFLWLIRSQSFFSLPSSLRSL